ncbi:hypothetical protein EDB87DRAFT_1829625 [Lactarius vividus]|nr:hypothetical protein EDB87DRAFT_1829625 [Lactarius vividus]
MAALSLTLPTVSPSPPQVHRTDSMGSNVSAGSVASLSRRPRTKGRPRAITVSSRRDRSPVGPGDFEAPHATGDEILANASYPPTTTSADPSPSTAPSRPPRSPLRAATHPKDGLSHPDIVPGLGWKAVDDMESSWRSRAVKIDDSTPQRRKRGSSVPRDAFRLSMLSSASSAQTNAFFTTLGEMQTVPHFTSLREARQRLRESNLTMQSGTASSVYPLTSSTVSGTESPCSPRSIADSFPDNHISSVDPDEPYDDYQAFNTDDVSYRLRLLVSNNYFLPPAHSKPSPSAFASPVIAPSKKTAKSVGPAFLDIFRVGKTRSKPTTPTGPAHPEFGPPRLRTTADSTITSSRAASARADPVPRGPVPPTLVAQTSRVAVVREKVDNLALAAEQAEQELKMRVDAKQNSAEHFDDYVDPTDAVDLPPPSENSPFAFQASALRGLGVENSLGAAVLAERLPPGSPGVWSLDPDEEAWRKALLHEAVGHSLNNTPESSFHTSSSHAATPSSGSMDPSFARSSPTPAPRASTPGMKRNLGQRIVEILEEQHEAIVPQSLSPSDAIPQSQLRGRNPSPMSHSSQLPLRAETPAEPQTVLPPPWRAPARPLRSSISTDSPGESQRMSQLSTSASTLRKTSSSPMLHLWHDGGPRRSRAVVSMTPPPPLVLNDRTSSVAISPVPLTPRDSMTSGSHYSVQGPESVDHLAGPEPMSTRQSFSSLLSRPSMSEYSQISPTVSAFNDGHFGPAPSIRESIPPDVVADVENFEGSRDTELIRHLSPPPRASSSFAIHSLHPPPRFPSSREPSPTLVVAQLPSLVPYPSTSSSDLGDSSERLSAYVTVAEQSDSSSFPFREHRAGAADALRNLQLSSLSIPSSMHSAPPPASPLEFFDQIDCDVMDEWETSDESDVDVESPGFTAAGGRPTPPESSQGHSSVLHAPRMTSTPSVSPAMSRDDLSVNSGSQERSPVGHVPRPPIYFKESSRDQGLSNYDLYRPSRSAAAPSSSRASSDTQVRGGSVEDKGYARKEGRTASMQRLDGLMLQHIEAERGTMSRIAKTVKDAHS